LYLSKADKTAQRRCDMKVKTRVKAGGGLLGMLSGN